MPAILFICLSKGRIEGTDEIAKGLVAHALNASILSAGEDPGVLLSIPEQ
jgi:hypothetical protein